MKRENDYDGDSKQLSEQQKLLSYYRYCQNSAAQKFKELTRDHLEDIRNLMKREQNRTVQEQTFQLLELKRGKLIMEMREHAEHCPYPQCKKVEEVVVLYGFSKGEEKRDYLNYVGFWGIKGLGFNQSKCPVGSLLNQEMWNTHRLLKSI